MTLDHTPTCKAYTGNNKTNTMVPISSYFSVQKLLSSIFSMVLWVSCMLSTIGFSCSSKSNHLPKGMEFGYKVSRLPHHTTRCVGSVTIFGMGDPADYIQGCIAPEQLMYQYVIDHDKDGNVTFKRVNIDPYPDPSDNIVATHPMHGTIPNWEGYGLTRLRPYKGPILNDTHTFSLDLGEAKFQNGEQLGFILVKPNVSLVGLVKYLLEKCASWSKQPHLCMEDYLMLPGVISEHTLQYSNTLNSFTKLNLNNYSNLYCYIKKGPHYCFIPLKNTVSAVTTAYSASSRSYAYTSKSKQAGPSSSNVAAPPESAASLKQGAPLDALPKVNGLLAEDKNTNGKSKPTNLLEELKAAGYNSIGSKMDHNNAPLETFPDAKIAQEKALEALGRNIETFEMIHKYVTESIKKIKIKALNDVTKNKISLSWENKIQSALSPALKAINSLQSALALEKAYQLSIEYRRPTNLSDQCSTVVQTLEKLKKTVSEEYFNLLSIEILLNQVIESLEEMYDLLGNIRKLLSSQDKVDDIRRSLNQLCIGNSTPLKNGKNIIAQLEQMEDEQLKMIQNFKQTASAISEMLRTICKELGLSIGAPLGKVISKIGSSNAELNLKLQSNIGARNVTSLEHIKDTIIDLELKEEDIQEAQAILNSLVAFPPKSRKNRTKNRRSIQ